ncbi:MAG: endonuclease/exonuclease/phosphatase family protein, partial [Bacteroidia bacterium]
LRPFRYKAGYGTSLPASGFSLQWRLIIYVSVPVKNLKNIIYYFITFIGVIIILASILSLIGSTSYWYIQLLDFPRPQYLVSAILCMILFIFLNKTWKFFSVLLLVGLIVAIIIQGRFILPYYYGLRSVPDAKHTNINKDSAVSILIANVLITNKESDLFLDIVYRNNPDMLLVMEVNQWWINQLQPLESIYNYNLKYPTDNAYGMALYSKLPLKNSEILFLNHNDVPSIHTDVVLPAGVVFRFYGVHPVAPVPSKKYPDNENDKGIALLKIGDMVAQNSMPAIVAGDYNDVSWSKTTQLFGIKGKLGNVRLSRGLYNTYNAKSLIKRWPLDHYFVSEEFSLVELKRLQKFNSDHFPLYAKFVLRK